ncbi:unnamed protein product [Absidia cylindrospora]
MGKSAKFYKRPSKKEKENLAHVKVNSPVINKKATEEKKSIVQQAAAATSALMDIDTPSTLKKKTKGPKQPEKPDYVDLLSGKKTYKRIPKKK